jgi:hypothetical protein
MKTDLVAPRHRENALRTWELELDAELPSAAPAVTAEHAGALAGLLARMPGVGVTAIVPHGQGRFVMASLAVGASDLPDAMARAAASLRSSAVAAGLGPLILVGARHAEVRPRRR